MDEVELLFSQVLKKDRISLYLEKDTYLKKHSAKKIGNALKRRINGEPIQYILGRANFFGLEFKVNSDCLIPRPETEILVEKAINMVTGLRSPVTGKIKILDIGTGSGCIAISLAKNLKVVEITAIDISKDALRIAKENAVYHKVNDKIKFIKGDLFNTHHLSPNAYHLIVSNPPYVSAKEMHDLPVEVRHEPRLALDGGRDGLTFYRKLIKFSPEYLNKNAFLILEIGYKQSNQIKKFLKKTNKFEIIEVLKDYNGIERIVVARYVGNRRR